MKRLLPNTISDAFELKNRIMAERAMYPFDAMLNLPGEPARLDYLVKEHEKLHRKFSALIDLLREKKVLSPDEVARFKAEEYV